jgi:hypothetical protein
MSHKWVKRWNVQSSSSSVTKHTVAISMDGVWGCSCRQWTMRRRECHHIQKIKAGEGKKFVDNPASIIELIALRVQQLKDNGKSEAQIEHILDADLESNEE